MEAPWRRSGASWRRLGGFLGRPWRDFLPVGAAGSISKRFEAVLEPSRRPLGAALEASWGVLEASWRLLRSSLATFFASWSPCRIRDLFSNELEPSWASFLNDF